MKAIEVESQFILACFNPFPGCDKVRTLASPVEEHMTDSSFQPVSGFDLPRFAGIPTFMRLPHIALDDPRICEVDIGLIGAPWDGGTTNRPGPRHGTSGVRP